MHPADTAIKLLLFFELVCRHKVSPFPSPPKKTKKPHSLFRNNTLMQSYRSPSQEVLQK